MRFAFHAGTLADCPKFYETVDHQGEEFAVVVSPFLWDWSEKSMQSFTDIVQFMSPRVKLGKHAATL